MLVSPRYPMRFTGERILTPEDLIDGTTTLADAFIVIDLLIDVF